MPAWFVKSPDRLLALLLDRRSELDISLATIDEIAGVADRYSSKVLTLRPTRRMGPTALAAIMSALALKIAEVKIEIDPEQAERLRSRWEKRGPSGPRPEIPQS